MHQNRRGEQDKEGKVEGIIRHREIRPAPRTQDQLLETLANFHEAFSLSEKERGETDWVQFEIDTGDAQLKRSPLRQMPFSVREEVSLLVNNMQETGVIVLSKSPWSSPVDLACKKDGSHSSALIIGASMESPNQTPTHSRGLMTCWINWVTRSSFPPWTLAIGRSRCIQDLEKRLLSPHLKDYLSLW